MQVIHQFNLVNMANNKIYIPTYVSDQNYNPSRVLPRVFFNNGMLDCETFYIDGWVNSNGSGSVYGQTKFPYFDNYNVPSGSSFPTEQSESLLFNNEAVVYGALPNNSLYSNYWNSYIELLYNPYTRLVRASAIIPLADYFDLELNDIVQFRSNTYHLRAINDYNIKNGECQIELLGPILPDSIKITVAPVTGSGDFGCDFNSDFDGKFVRSVC